MPVFMAATPDFVQKSPDTVVAYLKAWLEVASDFKDNPDKVADSIYAFYTSKGYTMSQETFRKALATVDVNPGFPSDSSPSIQNQAGTRPRRKKSSPFPNGPRRFRPDSWRRRAWAPESSSGDAREAGARAGLFSNPANSY